MATVMNTEIFSKLGEQLQQFNWGMIVIESSFPHIITIDSP